MKSDQRFLMNPQQEAFRHYLESRIEGKSHQCLTSKRGEPQKPCAYKLSYF